MRKAIIASASAIFVAAIVVSFAAEVAKMKITSSAFQEGGNIPSKFSCDGADTSPPLQIADVPPEAKNLVLIVDDPDAPSGLFTHWVVWNISPHTDNIGEGSAPKGVQGTSDFGKSGYGGPCPPSGTHRYVFVVYALARPLRLATGARAQAFAASVRAAGVLALSFFKPARARSHLYAEAINGHGYPEPSIITCYSRERPPRLRQ